MATPLAAAMLAEAGLSLDEPATQLANRWWEGQLPAKIGQIAELLFTFKTTPWQHQQRAMSFSVNKPATLLNLGMGCLGANTVVQVSRNKLSRKMTIGELYLQFARSKAKSPIYSRSLKGDIFGLNEVVDVIQSGVKKTIRITLECGKQIECTTDHLIAIPGDDKWMSAGSLVPGNEVLTNGIESCLFKCAGCECTVYRPKTNQNESGYYLCKDCVSKRASEALVECVVCKVKNKRNAKTESDYLCRPCKKEKAKKDRTIICEKCQFEFERSPSVQKNRKSVVCSVCISAEANKSKLNCVDCDAPIHRPPSTRKDGVEYRCRECRVRFMREQTGEDNPAWRGGRVIDQDGYVRIRMKDHPRSWGIGYVYEHILVMEKKIGREVPKDMHVHHINEVKHDNRPENLALLTPSEHNAVHRRQTNLDGNKVIFIPRVSKVATIEDAGEQMTYDIKMKGPHHNFVANGIVVHNCGKTLTTICLLQAWKSNLNLILCPKSVMGVWRREFHKHCNVSHNVTVLDKGTSKVKAEELKEAKRKANRYAINAVVINYESSWREHIGEALLGTAWDCVVADESHRIKEMSSNQSKFAGSLAEVSHRRLALTGTVMPRGAPIEVLGQYRFLEPAIYGTTKTRFQDKYCIMDSKVPGRVLSYINQDDFMEKFSRIAYRVQSKDVLTLPAIQQITIPVELEAKTRRYYETMKKECILELERGEVTAKNAAVKVMRLHQIACGHSKMEDGTIVHLGTEKRDVLMDMIEDIAEDEPIVVFCKFLEDLKSIEYIASKLKRRYGEISGARKDLTQHSTMPEHIDIMGVQVKAGGTGLDLTRARYMFWLSACDTWGDFDQAIARVHRPGQEKPVFVYHLAATNTVDIKIYRSLRNQEDVGMRLLECLDRKDEDE
jgi:hypothetical protein